MLRRVRRVLRLALVVDRRGVFLFVARRGVLLRHVHRVDVVVGGGDVVVVVRRRRRLRRRRLRRVVRERRPVREERILRRGRRRPRDASSVSVRPARRPLRHEQREANIAVVARRVLVRGDERRVEDDRAVDRTQRHPGRGELGTHIVGTPPPPPKKQLRARRARRRDAPRARVDDELREERRVGADVVRGRVEVDVVVLVVALVVVRVVVVVAAAGIVVRGVVVRERERGVVPRQPRRRRPQRRQPRRRQVDLPRRREPREPRVVSNDGQLPGVRERAQEVARRPRVRADALADSRDAAGAASSQRPEVEERAVERLLMDFSPPSDAARRVVVAAVRALELVRVQLKLVALRDDDVEELRAAEAAVHDVRHDRGRRERRHDEARGGG